MLNYQFRPIEQWPGERTKNRQRARFNSLYSKTLDLLERELSHLQARNVVLQADCDLSEIRNDGQLRSNARLRGPGVVLSFDSKHGPLSYPCDTYSDWQQNVRAIALALEALRAVDRYGVTRRAEQYKGWAKLAAPASGPFASVDQAAAFLSCHAKIGTSAWIGSRDDYRAVYRMAAATLHPDSSTGSEELFKRLQAAKEVLDKHHGI